MLKVTGGVCVQVVLREGGGGDVEGNRGSDVEDRAEGGRGEGREERVMLR